MTTGKWIEPDVPHRGWVCVDIEDLGEPCEICEMCEVMTIRYVHLMEHADYPEALRCGCVCAGHMEEDYAGARRREAAFKASRARRKNWLNRRWHRTLTGGEYLNTDGFHVSVWPKYDGSFAAKVGCRASEQVRYSKRRYETMDAAKLAAFDAMIAMRIG